MNRHRLLSGLLVVMIALSLSAEAWARAGKSGSLGSRGSRTFDRPIERSITPTPAPTPGPSQPGTAQPMYNPNAVRPAAPAAAAPAMAQQPGFFQRNPIMGGIMGGLIGAGIGSMLFGNSPAMAAASDAAPMASLFGTLLQVALIGGLIYMAMRLFRRRAQPAGGPTDAAPAYQRQAQGSAPGSALGGNGERVAKEFEVDPDDQAQFGRIIEGVQKAWSEGNPVALRQWVTPEVAGWIGEDLARDQAEGLRNVVEDVTLLKGDVTETWRENGVEYATAVITFSARDYMVRLSDGGVVEGDPRHPVETTEAWTFVRGSGGTWVLSAIEQM